VSGSCSYVGRNSAKYKCIKFCGILERKKYTNDICLMIFEMHANLKYKFGNRHFWCRGYYVDTVGKNAKKIQEYIQNQLKEDLEYDQMTLKEYIDPFTGEPVKAEIICDKPENNKFMILSTK
jgi:GH25 family lysozyme M1 (1,4-beta-N-acetylmuramidase)